MGLYHVICILMSLSLRFYCYCKYMVVSGFWPIVPGIVAGENSLLCTNKTR